MGSLFFHSALLSILLCSIFLFDNGNKNGQKHRSYQSKDEENYTEMWAVYDYRPVMLHNQLLVRVASEFAVLFPFSR